jgi:hypothetical protein
MESIVYFWKMESANEKASKRVGKVNTKMVVGQSAEVLLAYLFVLWTERLMSFAFAVFYQVDPVFHLVGLATGAEGWTGDAVFGVYLLPPLLIALVGITVLETWKIWMAWKWIPRSLVFWIAAFASSRLLLGGIVGAFSSAELGYVYTWAFIPRVVQVALALVLLGLYLLYMAHYRMSFLALNPYKKGVKSDHLRIRYTWLAMTLPLLGPFALLAGTYLVRGFSNELYFTGLWAAIGFFMLWLNDQSSPQYHYVRRYRQKVAFKISAWMGVMFLLAVALWMG